MFKLFMFIYHFNIYHFHQMINVQEMFNHTARMNYTQYSEEKKRTKLTFDSNFGVFKSKIIFLQSYTTRKQLFMLPSFVLQHGIRKDSCDLDFFDNKILLFLTLTNFDLAEFDSLVHNHF